MSHHNDIMPAAWHTPERRVLTDVRRQLLDQLPDNGPGVRGLHVSGATLLSARWLVRQNLAVEKGHHPKAGAFFARTPTGAKEARHGR